MVIEFIVVLICLLLNALLSLVEMAFVSVSKPELKQLARTGLPAAQRLLKLRENPERTLSVLQIGITVVGALSAAVGGAGAKESFVPYLTGDLHLSQLTSEILAIVIVVVPITFLSVVVGELVPKSIALRYPMKIALIGSTWLTMGEAVLNPVVRLFERTTQFFLKLIFPRWKKSSGVTEEADSVNIANLSGAHRQFVINLVHIEMKRLRDILLPWAKVDRVYVDNTLNEVLSVVIKSGHTRLPVIEGNEVIGLLHSKEFLSFISSGDENWKKIIRNVIRVNPYDGILKTLRTMQEVKSHMALVVQGGEVLGIVTLEDIIEEIVGDIFDEDDDGKIKKILSSRSYQKSK